MASRIKKGDLVKIISGKLKGTTAKVELVLPHKNAAVLEGIGIGHRHLKPSIINPRGGSKDIHRPVALSKLALVVDEKNLTTSRVGYVKSQDGQKVRLARQLKNKEIK